MTASDDSTSGAVPVTEGQPKPTLDNDSDANDKAVPAGSRRIAWRLMLVIVVVVFAAGFLVAALVGPRLGGLLPWGSNAGGTPTAPKIEQIAALERRVTAHANRLAETETKLDELAARSATPNANLNQELAALRRALGKQAGQIAATEQAVESAAGSASRVAAIERRLDELARAGNQEAIAVDLLARIEGLERRFGDLTHAPGDTSTARRDQRLDELERRVAALPPQPDVGGAADERLARLESTMAALTDRLDRTKEGAGPRLGRAVTALLAAAALRDAARRHTGYAGELAALRRTAADLPAFAAAPVVTALDELEAHAANGTPTVAVLAVRFGDQAGAIVRVANRDEQAGWVSQTIDRVSTVVTVRRVGDVAGDSIDARVARAELRVSAGDLAAAVRELAALDGRAAEAAMPWLDSARARLAVDRATRLLYEAAVRSLLAAVAGE